MAFLLVFYIISVIIYILYIIKVKIKKYHMVAVALAQSRMPLQQFLLFSPARFAAVISLFELMYEVDTVW